MPKLSTSAQQLAPFFRESGMRAEFGKNDYPVPVELRPLPYMEQWRLMIDRGWYSYKLEDHSLFSFIEEDGGSSFSYLPCPLQVASLGEFSRTKGLAGAAMYSSENQAQYDLYLTTASAKEHVIPVRFDFDPRGYDERSHPLCHLHFGHNAETRIGTARMWSPLAFGLFILRQYYPDRWRTLLTRPSASSLSRRIRTGLSEVEVRFTDPIFTREAYFF